MASPSPVPRATDTAEIGRTGVRVSRLGLGGVALHAAGLSFVHPATGETVELSSPLPNRIARLLSHLRK